MNREQMTVAAALTVAALALLAALLMGGYLLRTLNRMQKLLRDYREKGSAAFQTMKETRESRLESSLERILQQAAGKEEAAERERDEVAALLSDLSHQLKTPMANVRMYTELLEDDTLSEEQRRRFAQQANAQAEKMQWLLESMLKASQLERGMIVFTAQFSGIRETIGRAVSGIYAQAEEKAITLQVEPFEDRRLWHEPGWTAEALGNLLDNAVKYSPEGSTITVRVQPMEIYTQIEICDQGQGIAKEEYNKIFQRFYRGENTGHTGGSGLGLYLAQLILNKEQGYITVDSREGAGSCFRVFLLNEV